MTTSERCENCRYWRTNQDIGEYKRACIRFPPQVVYKPTGEAGGKAMFPATGPEDWCGEWKKSK